MQDTVSHTPALQLFTCPGCNAQLNFDPRSQQLVCDHCGTKVQITKGSDLIKESPLKAAIAGTDTANTIEQLVHKCERCGAQTAFTSETATFVCGFCNYEVVNPGAYKTRLIQPSGLVPFAIDKQQGLDIFKSWIGKGFWTPGNLKEFARTEHVKGMYIPFWTYDAQTDSNWEGYGGRYYYETEHYTDSQGQRQSRQVQRTEWIYQSGNYSHFFDDILIGGSNELTQAQYEKVFPYNLAALVNFDASYLSGWDAEVYDVSVSDGYTRAEQIMKDRIEDACVELCRIDTYRDLSVATQYAAQTYKHILLPIWICSYMYKSKPYYFIVNGQTGKIDGKKPVSGSKVALAIILAIIVIVFILIASHANG